MILYFDKYQGTGNDFVLVNAIKHPEYLELTDEQVRFICDRRFGIGADGFILVAPSREADFKMIYHNADGKKGSLCGNGGRCTVAFAYKEGIIGSSCRFEAYDGLHFAAINAGEIELSLSDIDGIHEEKDHFILDTGSPHYVTFVEDVSDLDIRESGRVIRYSDRFASQGINVNFVEKEEDAIVVATYERGVEDETLSCGTGVTASAISYAFHDKKPGKHIIKVKTKGGNLKVKLQRNGPKVTDIFLCGPATFVFAGTIEI